MKKLSKSTRLWLKSKQKTLLKRYRKLEYRKNIKSKGELQKNKTKWWTRSINAPENFRLREDNKHIELLQFIRDLHNTDQIDERLRINFEHTKLMNVDALLLFMANLENAIAKKVGGYIKIAPAKKPSVNGVLTKVGILELCGQDFHINPTNDKSVLNWELLKGNASDKLYPKTIHAFLAKFFRCEVPKVLFAAVREALLNIKHHAYKNTEGKWWVLARLHKEDAVFTIVVCDLGMGIPESIKCGEQDIQKEIWRKLQELIEKLPLAGGVKDSKIIEESMQYGVSSTKQGYRGKGLPKMREVVELIDTTQARINIYSDRGCYSKLGGVHTATLNDYPDSIGGTVVTWTIPINADDVMKSKRESRHDAKHR